MKKYCGVVCRRADLDFDFNWSGFVAQTKSLTVLPYGKFQVAILDLAAILNFEEKFKIADKI